MEPLTSVVSHVTLCRQIVDIIDESATSSSDATARDMSTAHGASFPDHVASAVVTRTTCTANESIVSRRRPEVVMLTLSDVETIRRNVVSLQRHYNDMTSQLIDSRRQVKRYSKQLKTLQAAAAFQTTTAAVVVGRSFRPSANTVMPQSPLLTYMATPPSASVAATRTAASLASPIPPGGAGAGSVGIVDDSAVCLHVRGEKATTRTTSKSGTEMSRLQEDDAAAEHHVGHILAFHSLAGKDLKSSSQTSVAEAVGVSLQPRPLPRNTHESHADRVQRHAPYMSAAAAAAASPGTIVPPGIVNTLIAQNSRLQKALRDVVTERYGSVDGYLTVREYDDVIVQLRDDIKQLRRKNSQLQSLLADKCGLSAVAERLAHLKCSQLSDKMSSEGDFIADIKSQKTPVGEIPTAQLTSKTSSLANIRESAVESSSSSSDSDVVCRTMCGGGGVTGDAQNAVPPFLSCSRCEREFPCSEMLRYVSHCTKCCD